MKTAKHKTKKPLNVLIDTNLLESARDYEVNLSALLDRALREELGKIWRVKNTGAIDAYNELIEKEGTWSDGFRTW